MPGSTHSALRVYAGMPECVLSSNKDTSGTKRVDKAPFSLKDPQSNDVIFFCNTLALVMIDLHIS